MDRYSGYVSNNYRDHAMASQTRVMSGTTGSSAGYGCNQYKPMQQFSGNGRPVVYEQPQPTRRDVKKMVFSHEGREWTTGVCGCFEHCASCTCYHNSVLFSLAS